MPLLSVFQRFLDFFLVSCFLTPLTVSFWRGTWYSLDLFVFPDDKLASALGNSHFRFHRTVLDAVCGGLRQGVF